MRKLLTYRPNQFTALKNELEGQGLQVVPILRLCTESQLAELDGVEKMAVDVSSMVGLLLESTPVAPRLELLVHGLPEETVFIGDEDLIYGNAYALRAMFDELENCMTDVNEGEGEMSHKKKTIVSLSDDDLKKTLAALESGLIGQSEFKKAFKSCVRSFRLFNSIGEQPMLSMLLLGPSGVGKTEVAKILCEASAPGEPLPKINLGNYSSKDSLNSLIGSPRGYMGSEEGELGKKIDASSAGILLIDEFEKAEPAVWNFFLDLLETGSFTDSLGVKHDLNGFVAVFTTNCPREKLNETFPAELLSRFNLKVHFSKLSTREKEIFVSKYVEAFADKYKSLNNQPFPALPSGIVDKALLGIDVRNFDNIRVLKDATRSWLSNFIVELGDEEN